MIHFRTFDNTAQLASHLAEILYRELKCAVPSPGMNGILIPGGSTPLAAYRQLSELDPLTDCNAHVFLTDDRFVPQDNEKSNAGTIRPRFLKVGVPDSHVHAVDTSRTIEHAAEDYADQLQHYFSRGGHIRTAFLGMGADGHTCGLFSKADLAESTGQTVIGVHRPDGMRGVTVTPELLQEVESIIFVITGAEKAAMVTALRRDPDSVIAGNVIQDHPAVHCWLDPAADSSTDAG